MLQATSMLIKRLTQRQANLEARLIDQEGRTRIDNLRIYGILEDKEGSNMTSFLDKLLKNTLDFPPAKESSGFSGHTRHWDQSPAGSRSLDLSW